MRIPATEQRKFDFVITRRDPALRSVRVLVMNKPGDGDKMVAWEYGAIKSEAGDDYQVEGTLTPSKVYHSMSWETKT
jgi:hypothetical protein